MARSGEEKRADQKSTIERLLDEEQVLVHINTTVTGVVVPSHLMQNKTVTLRLSRYFKGQLHTDAQKITAELLFGSVYHTCVIPWESIWGASAPHGEEFLWKEVAPDEIAHLLHDNPSTSSKGATTTTPKKPISRSVSPRKQVGHLRRIK